MKKVNKPKEIARAMNLVWESLDSHLEYTYKGKMIRDESHAFHIKAVKDYAEILFILSKLY